MKINFATFFSNDVLNNVFHTKMMPKTCHLACEDYPNCAKCIELAFSTYVLHGSRIEMAKKEIFRKQVENSKITETADEETSAGELQQNSLEKLLLAGFNNCYSNIGYQFIFYCYHASIYILMLQRGRLYLSNKIKDQM